MFGLFKKKKRDASEASITNFLSGFSSDSGSVTPTNAQKVAAVYACETAIAESVSMLPATVVVEKSNKKKEDDRKHPLYKLLRVAPNEFMDSFVFMETMQRNLVRYGNAYAYKETDRGKRITGLRPLPSRMVETKIEDGALKYIYRSDRGEKKDYSIDEIFHIKYNSEDGVVGKSIIETAGDNINFGLSLLKHGKALFENGVFSSGFVKTPGVFRDDEVRKNFVNSFKDIVGARNSGKIGLLENGAEWVTAMMKAEDSQFSQSHEFSVVQIARLYRMPPVMIQAMDKGMSFASVEQLAIMFVQYTIQPWITRWERAIKHQLLDGEENHSVKFNVQALLRGDLKSRTEAVVQQLQYGLKTINEARYLLDENGVDHEIGDEILVSHNLVPASVALKNTGPQVPPPTQTEEPQKDPEPKPDNKTRIFPLFDMLFERAERKEEKQLQAALKKNEVLKWAEKFYPEHARAMVEDLEVAAQAVGADRSKASLFVGAYVKARQEDILRWAETGDATALTGDPAAWLEFLVELIGGKNGDAEPPA